MNKYWHGFARSMIILGVLFCSTVVTAEQIIVMSNTRKDLPMKIETTNISNQGYVWQFEIIPNQNTRQVQAKLLNPNPNKSMLNTRALEIAKKITLDQLPQVNNDFQNRVLNSDENTIARTQYYYGKYTLFIKFPESVQYAVKPNFSHLQSALEPFCNRQQDNKLRFDEQGDIQINAKLFVNTQGQIQNIQYIPAIAPKISNILEPLVKKIRFYPRNEYGILKSFSIEQPLIIQCH